MDTLGLNPHWHLFADLWPGIGTPLRPVAEDIEIIRETLHSTFSPDPPRSPRYMLLLGVTPEIASMDVPPSTFLLAVDRDLKMISGVWPGNAPGRAAVCADWLSLPLPDASIEFAVGDGCLALLRYPDEFRHFGNAIRKCLSPGGGQLLLRVFCRPDESETVDQIFSDLQNRRIGSFDAFKWRLLMALQGDDPGRGVLVSDAWTVWHERVPDPEKFAGFQNWPLSKVQVIDAYRNVPTRYSFPSRPEVIAAFSPYFEMISCRYGGYELAERCPHLLFRTLHG